MTLPLIKITSPTAAEICQEYPSAATPVPPNQTPAQYLSTLQQNQQSEEAIRFLAHGMPERESTWWAVESAKKVSPAGDSADQAAIQAAEAWVKNPNPATQQQAALAAAQTNYQTPGAWAAQAAAWSKPAGASIPGTPAVPGAPSVPRLTPHAVTGSVMLAAAMSAQPPKLAPPSLKQPALSAPQFNTPTLSLPETPALPPTPQQQAQTAKIHQPFLDLGTDIASGNNSWA